MFIFILGSYMYIEMLLFCKFGDYVCLEFFIYSVIDGNGKCLVFWYYMYGSGIGRFNVYIKCGNFFGLRVWMVFGNYGNRWLRGMIIV